MTTAPKDQDSHTSTRLEKLALRSSSDALEEYVESLTVSETARALSELPTDTQTSVITTLLPEDAARIVESIPEAQAAEIVSKLTTEAAAKIIDNVQSDEQTDILSKLSASQAEEILAAMDVEEAKDVRKRMRLNPHSAGGLMLTEFLSYSQDLLVKDVVEDLRERSDTLSDHSVQYVFVVSNKKELLGVLRLRDLVLEPSDTPVNEIMIKHPISVSTSMELPNLEDIFHKHRFLGIPVVDSANRIVGIVRRADIEEAAGERSESDYLKSSGILGGEELRSMPLLGRSRRRLSWLSANIILNIIAASIIAVHQETLQAVVALAVFLPIISDMSGCSGAQAIAVSIRELTLGLVRPNEVLRVLKNEVLLGTINGLSLGCLLAGAAWLWQGNPYLGVVVGVALAINTIVAVTIGGSIPLILKRLDKDPALASGPILTTLTDMCGFWLVLSLANIALPWIK